jgi:hypothetical protein
LPAVGSITRSHLNGGISDCGWLSQYCEEEFKERFEVSDRSLVDSRMTTSTFVKLVRGFLLDEAKSVDTDLVLHIRAHAARDGHLGLKPTHEYDTIQLVHILGIYKVCCDQRKAQGLSEPRLFILIQACYSGLCGPTTCLSPSWSLPQCCNSSTMSGQSEELRRPAIYSELDRLAEVS